MEGRGRGGGGAGGVRKGVGRDETGLFVWWGAVVVVVCVEETVDCPFGRHSAMGEGTSSVHVPPSRFQVLNRTIHNYIASISHS